MLGRRVREQHNINNVRELEVTLHQKWADLPMDKINKLIYSVRRRCLAVVAADGGHTRN